MTQPGYVNIDDPIPGKLMTGTMDVDVTALKTDGTDADSVEFWDGHPDNLGSSNLNTDSTPPFSYSWDTTTAKEGKHLLYVKAYDGTDYLISESVLVWIDNDDEPDVYAVFSALNDPSVTQMELHVVQQKINAASNRIEHYKKADATSEQIYNAKLAYAALFTYQSFIAGVERAMGRFPIASVQLMERLKEAAEEQFKICCIPAEKNKIDPFIVNTKGTLNGRERYFLY